jgi:hypothetical protein
VTEERPKSTNVCVEFEECTHLWESFQMLDRTAAAATVTVTVMPKLHAIGYGTLINSVCFADQVAALFVWRQLIMCLHAALLECEAALLVD